MATFDLDLAHSQVSFSAKHMMVTTVRGTFHELEGTVELDEANPTASSAEFSVKTASIDTAFSARDNHLRSADFLSSEQFPKLVVKSTAVRHSIENEYVVTADVTIRDITRPVDFDVVFLGFFAGMDGARHAGFSARAKVNRKDWDLNWNVALEAGGWLVGDEIKLEIEIAVLQAVALAA